jgi:hypothetical protein
MVESQMIEGSEASTGLLTFDQVEERLIEAMLLWRRAPDRERGWLTVRAFWPEIARQGWRVGVDGEWDERADEEERQEPRPLPLTRAQVAEMNQVGEWFVILPEADRKLVAMAIAALASGKKRIPWSRLLKPMGMKRGAGSLAKRYGRALGYLAFRLNGRTDAEAKRLVQRRGSGWEQVMGDCGHA